MKKILFIIIVLVGLLLATGCSSDNVAKKCDGNIYYLVNETTSGDDVKRYIYVYDIEADANTTDRMVNSEKCIIVYKDNTLTLYTAGQIYSQQKVESFGNTLVPYNTHNYPNNPIAFNVYISSEKLVLQQGVSGSSKAESYIGALYVTEKYAKRNGIEIIDLP